MNTKQEWHDGTCTATCLMFHLLHQGELPLTAAYAPQEKSKGNRGQPYSSHPKNLSGFKRCDIGLLSCAIVDFLEAHKLAGPLWSAPN